MKRAILVLFFWVMAHAVFGQVMVDDVDINKLENVTFIQVLAVQTGVFSNKSVVLVDYGQKQTYTAAKPPILKKEGGEVMKFNGIIDAVNFLTANGWEYVNNTITSDAGNVVDRFVLKKVTK